MLFLPLRSNSPHPRRMAPAPGSTGAASPSIAFTSSTLASISTFISASASSTSSASTWYSQLAFILPFLFIIIGIFIFMISTFLTILYRARRRSPPVKRLLSTAPRALLLQKRLSKGRPAQRHKGKMDPFTTIAALSAQSALLACAPIKFPCNPRKMEKSRGWSRAMSTMSMDFVCRGMSWSWSTAGVSNHGSRFSAMGSNASRSSMSIQEVGQQREILEVESRERRSSEPLLDEGSFSRSGLGYTLRLTDGLDDDLSRAGWLDLLMRDELEDIPEEDETPSDDGHGMESDLPARPDSGVERKSLSLISFPLPPAHEYITHTPTGAGLRPYKSFNSLGITEGTSPTRSLMQRQSLDLSPRRSRSEAVLTTPSPVVIKSRPAVDSQEFDLAEMRARRTFFTFAHTSYTSFSSSTFSSIADDELDRDI